MLTKDITEDAYRRFVEALKDLKDLSVLLGNGASEVAEARRHVARTRDRAIAAWRRGQLAA